MNNDIYGRQPPLAKARNPFTCGLTGRTYTRPQMTERVDFLARALGKRTGWKPNEGTAWDKVACVFSLNTVIILLNISTCRTQTDSASD